MWRGEGGEGGTTRPARSTSASWRSPISASFVIFFQASVTQLSDRVDWALIHRRQDRRRRRRRPTFFRSGRWNLVDFGPSRIYLTFSSFLPSQWNGFESWCGFFKNQKKIWWKNRRKFLEFELKTLLKKNSKLFFFTIQHNWRSFTNFAQLDFESGYILFALISLSLSAWVN